MSDAIIVLGMDHRIWLWNRNAERLYGWSADEVLGRPIHTLLPADGAALPHACEAVYTHGEWNGEMTQRRKNGTMAVAVARWVCLANEQGDPFAIVAIHHASWRSPKAR